ncbi:hypothetical protein M758_8G049600 [Ceratodon purpureus]|uniref:Pectate lyase n=1 Tax=Ceratodon purpureus TaxID=3225 RepID=A0A8T0GZU1_CERPU|nr:hypothetical protein KC19_8G051600 [Ceratodon purpureus]KAG0607720.1 hypothetical protein M758_8G049600 [Ceratodon purpureus]KAG0607721.1 hypothetical protein M758_8G049600 [Ceratodon purpureus]
MATSKALLHLLLLVLAAQWISVHARSMKGDYDTMIQPGDYQQPSTEYLDIQNNDAVAFAGEWNSQSDSLSFAKNSPDSTTYDYATDKNFGDSAADSLDSETFSFQEDSQSTPVTDSTKQDVEQLPYDTFIDSPEIVEDAGTSSFTNETTVFDQSSVESDEHSPEEYANDEVFFDTSSADTIYKSNDDGLSLAAATLEESSTDDMLASLSKAMGGCGTGNPIDDCWRCDPNWRSHRQALASCATGFGRNALGGKNGPIYVVTSNGDDTKNPQRGTLRYGVTREGPLWIIFAKSMTIKLKGELWVSAYKTIDGRGAEVHITGGSQISIQKTNNVIIHGLHIHDIRPSGPSTIRVSPSKVVRRGKSEGDGIHIWESRDVWIDHCYLAKATDGLLDVTRGSTMITISNCFLEKHDKVMLLGASPKHTQDRGMRVTVAFNKFGPGLIQRLPRYVLPFPLVIYCC